MTSDGQPVESTVFLHNDLQTKTIKVYLYIGIYENLLKLAFRVAPGIDERREQGLPPLVFNKINLNSFLLAIKKWRKNTYIIYWNKDFNFQFLFIQFLL